MSVGTLRGLNIHGGTFAFTSHYPKLHMPAFQVADTNLVDPNHADCLLDGELVAIGAGSVGGVTVIGSNRANQVTLAASGASINVTHVSNAAGVTVVYGSATAPTQFAIKHGRKGRGDSQFFGAVPCVMDSDFEFVTRLADDDATFAVGDLLFPIVLLTAKVHTYVKDTMGVTRSVVGLTNAAGLALTAAGGAPTVPGTALASGQNIPYVAVCRSPQDANGWIKAVWKSGTYHT